MNKTDIIVIGTGHAGIEAALAASRMGCKVIMFTINKENIGLMPCNPSIGGPAKGQIVGEIDALGGEMGKAADATMLQMKVLNRSRGPAVQCLRSQNDKIEYQRYMQRIIQNNINITVIEASVDELLIENNHIQGVKASQKTYKAKAVIITSGTFLKGLMHTGNEQKKGGRVGEPPASSLSDSLKKHLKLGRLKTGTPPRLDKDSINYKKLRIEPGDDQWLHFSFETTYNTRYQNQVPCYLSYTNKDSHNLILNNLDRSPLYQKVIKGVGPRYCPSIEDKIVRFKDKDQHHIFIEPESLHTNEIYPQGLNTSLPADIQLALLKSMVGLEDVKVIRYGYAVEYDFIYPNQLKATLECKQIKNLFSAGQINGTSGYEEAAGQGVIAGINAAANCQKRKPFILTRQDSYIGTLIDDLITKPIYEPYRMLSSRSEYRLLLRQDNPWYRLSKKAHDYDLLTKTQITLIQNNETRIHQILKSWQKTPCTPQHLSTFNLDHQCRLAHLVKRPDFTLKHLDLPDTCTESEKERQHQALVMAKYEGYIKKQAQDIEKINKQEKKEIPSSINYDSILGLRNESREKLKSEQPKTIYEAKRIAGINPADIMILLVYLDSKKQQKTKK
ncbi:MAG: tRNA uridine-5-carboxymethylaminomethyl(34) synthesis enzyme MnmG [bacterium]